MTGSGGESSKVSLARWFKALLRLGIRVQLSTGNREAARGVNYAKIAKTIETQRHREHRRKGGRAGDGREMDGGRLMDAY